jgi:hypothetical protein
VVVSLTFGDAAVVGLILPVNVEISYIFHRKVGELRPNALNSLVSFFWYDFCINQYSLYKINWEKKMKTTKLLAVKVLALLSLCFSTAAMAGPIIIAGTDADDHGFVSGGQNVTGWEFMQKSFENIGAAVTNGQKSIVCIGCNGSQASAAFNSATGLATLGAGWSFFSVTSTTDITRFFDGTGVRNVNNTGIVYMPTVANNVDGGINDAQLVVVNGNGAVLNNFVAAGGGLFTQEQANSTIGYGWLQSLIPGFTALGDNTTGIANSGQLQLTAAGSAAFPGLTNSDLSNATPWHAWFENYGALQVLAVGDGDRAGGFNDAVIIGGGVGAVLACGTQGQPPCAVPEPAPLSLLGLGVLGFLVARRKTVRK